MNYASAIQSVLRLDETVYLAIASENRTARYCMISVAVFGFLHALSSLHFSNVVLTGGQITEPIPMVSQIVIIMIGMVVAFFMHAGGAMFLWIFTRGVGGDTAFLPLYFNLGISFAGLWPLAPILAGFQSGIRGSIMYGVLGLATVYGITVVYYGTKSASKLSAAKTMMAMTATIIFVVCFMYLWI